ncbi:MAG: diguanylate cyclase [Aquabacterium sp.]|nr:diguanylate cyclase [Aquabacterium sp.]
MQDASRQSSSSPVHPLADDALVRATFDSAPDGIVVVGIDGRILAFNARFLALWNFPADMLARRDAVEMRQHTANQLQDPQAYLRSLRMLAGTDRSQVFDSVALVDGRVFERHVSPVQVPGRPAALVVRWRDITARHQAEQALARSRARLSAIFEHALNAILLASDEGRYLDANPAACAMLGYPHAQLVGMRVVDVVVPDTLDVVANWAGFLESGSSRGRIRLRRSDGVQLDAQYNAVAHMLPGVHLSILSDLSDEVRAQRRQQELTALLELAMMDADTAFWDVDLQALRVSSLNTHWHTMLGYAPGEVPDTLQAWDALVHPDDAAERSRAWFDHVQGRSSTYQAEFRMRHQQGHWVWMQARGRAVARDAQGMATRVVGLRTDISARKLVEQRLERLAHTDALTSVVNRRRFTELAADELSRASRHGQPLALLMMDLDHFKAVNDRFGHAGGDEVLRAFVDIAHGVMRQGDVLARVGGEEFAALLPQTTLEGALALAQRLRQAVHDHPTLLDGVAVPCTVSIGVAGLAEGEAEQASIDALMVAADRALYACKAQGRDRVLVAGPR